MNEDLETAKEANEPIVNPEGPRLSDFFWRPWYVKVWWVTCLVYCSLKYAAHSTDLRQIAAWRDGVMFPALLLPQTIIFTLLFFWCRAVVFFRWKLGDDEQGLECTDGDDSDFGFDAPTNIMIDANHPLSLANPTNPASPLNPAHPVRQV
ncbi:hypothetical protein [Sphingomonas immobilis]|uniref:Uncharacterized protein n=1 Tax=Sphingomonas immobilis TaxID=3063997 RepID=A0ABT8ZVZ6_9SPHN|nr:hypothetical protein [Sphingomonas sp. CA1-15]MDO7841750.1 hypothetical protein [Sphingomonas sp. CA1-15]